MTTLEVFAPTWCTASFVEHDGETEACRFAADLEWLRGHAVEVVHVALCDEPGRFVEHDAVRFLMNVLGPEVLPVILVDGLMRSHGTYPSRETLAGWAGVDLELELEHADAPIGLPTDALPTDGVVAAGLLTDIPATAEGAAVAFSLELAS